MTTNTELSLAFSRSVAARLEGNVQLEWDLGVDLVDDEVGVGLAASVEADHLLVKEAEATKHRVSKLVRSRAKIYRIFLF
jgi:hypothetical protein